MMKTAKEKIANLLEMQGNLVGRANSIIRNWMRKHEIVELKFNRPVVYCADWSDVTGLRIDTGGVLKVLRGDESLQLACMACALEYADAMIVNMEIGEYTVVTSEAAVGCVVDGTRTAKP